MDSTVVTAPATKRGNGGSPPPGKGNHGPGGSDGDVGRQPSNGSLPPGAYRIAIWVGIVSISVLFLALTAAMLVRAESSAEWVHAQIPSILYFNTLVLVLSSLTLELSRRALRMEAGKRFIGWLYATTALGITFIACQFFAWRELAAHGIYVTTNPSSSFFYVLTAAHGIHLLGGILALFYLVLRSRKIIANPSKRIAVQITAIYWHFMDVLWIYILILLKVKL
ncbi:MAG TPA: cytochrome c oxidase subunit 3 [Terriglobia bacterium]|nr:cytochrome c oxidase subunit 3 [Terriglobia bacterium]